MKTVIEMQTMDAAMKFFRENMDIAEKVSNASRENAHDARLELAMRLYVESLKDENLKKCSAVDKAELAILRANAFFGVWNEKNK